jgi:hypothetical protein
MSANTPGLVELVASIREEIESRKNQQKKLLMPLKANSFLAQSLKKTINPVLLANV